MFITQIVYIMKFNLNAIHKISHSKTHSNHEVSQV